MSSAPAFNVDPLLHDCRKLRLRGHQVMARIGIHDFERAAPQRLLLDIDLYVPLQQSTPTQDRIDEVVDYDFVRAVVAERIGRGQIGLQETLCDDLLETLLRHPGVVAARVVSAKPDVYPDCASVGVEVFRAKPAARPAAPATAPDDRPAPPTRA